MVFSTTFSSSKKRDLGNSEDEVSEKWWNLFCSQETKSESVFSTQASSSSSQAITSQPFDLPPTQTCVDKDDNWNDDESEKDDKKEEKNDKGDPKVEFYVKVGKHKNLSFFNFLFRKKMNNQEINQISNLISRYHIENTKQNLERLKIVLKQKENYIVQLNFQFD